MNLIKDLRVYHAPRITHKDFQCWIYQCQEQSYKFLYEDWEFAVKRQGFKTMDFNEKVFKLEDLDRRHHWMLIKPNTDSARQRLLALDYNVLARLDGTSRIGFGKADLIVFYEGQRSE